MRGVFLEIRLAFGVDQGGRASTIAGFAPRTAGPRNANGEPTAKDEYDILFATDSATLRYDQLGDLNAVAASLQRYPDSRIEIVGHTDHDGDAAYNQDLSERRARAVQAALQQAGVPAARLTAIGRGESQPVASNYTAQGKAANRRVEIFIRGNR